MKIERVQQFVEKIAEATFAGQVEWDQKADNYFAARVGSGFVTISESAPENPWEEPDYVIGFRNAKDEFIVAFADTDFRGVWSDAFKVLRGLYREVRLEALGFDDVLDEMSKDLDKRDL